MYKIINTKKAFKNQFFEGFFSVDASLKPVFESFFFWRLFSVFWRLFSVDFLVLKSQFFEGFFSVDETVKSIPVLCSKICTK